MNTVKITDVSMKQSGKNHDFSLSFKDKLELSKLLDKLGVSVIELEAVTQPKVDALRIKSISSAVKNSIIAVPAGYDEETVQLVWNSLKEAVHPRLQVSVPVSTVQMEYIFHKKPDAVLAIIKNMVSACREKTADVEFLAEDATRSDDSFLYKAIQTAIDAGASTVTVCDAAGAMLPDEFGAFLDGIMENVPDIKNITLGVSCSNALSMADACAIAAVRAGAGEIKSAAYPVDTVSLANISRIISAKGSAYNAMCSIHTVELKRVMGQIEWICSTRRNKNSPFENGVREEGEDFVLTSHDDISAVMKAAAKLGYELSEEDGAAVWEAFGRISAKKDKIGSKELDAIIASAAMQVPPTYTLESYVINSGNTMTATSHIILRKGGEKLESVSLGDGPIDASFLAFEQITGHHYDLDDFQIKAVTEGHEAMGEAVVRLMSNGKLYSGRGISTDIIGASILAYVSALNKIVYEEAEA